MCPSGSCFDPRLAFDARVDETWGDGMSLSESDRAFLLRLARDTLARALAGEEMSAPDPDPLPESLVRHRGVFVSIYRGTEFLGAKDL